MWLPEKSRYLEASEEDGMFGIFGFIGRIPTTEISRKPIWKWMTEDISLQTKICTPIFPAFFTVGDVRVKSLRQVVTAAADGAIAATQAEKYINEHK